MIEKGNIFADIPAPAAEEDFHEILSMGGVRIERIISHGHVTPPGQWYDQDTNEWVLVLKGAGEIEFADGGKTLLETGDHILLRKHARHRVSRTTDGVIWLAVHF